MRVRFFPAGRAGWAWLAFRLVVLAAVSVMVLRWCTRMPGRARPEVPPAASPREAAAAERIRAHVAALASGIGERHLGRPEALEAAARAIETALAREGLQVRREVFVAAGRRVANIVAEPPGPPPGEGWIVVGAHYDTVPGSPGANDNASGVAVLIETARLLAGRRLDPAPRFVAFVNEEPPWFRTEAMGSRVHVRRAMERGDRMVGMLALETVGCYSSEPGRQRYPFPLGYFYPDRADFVAFVAMPGARRLLRRAVAAFRAAARLPSEVLLAPAWVPGVDWSDHASFQAAGIPAVMVTDTAFYRDPHYHRATDTPERLDARSMARLALGLAGMLRRLGGDAPPP
ncbi:M28 family peptidase [Dissulfurirhabdus thermomarina]|uniref:M28 family peptidase n=1 Tax=Dissulfurirhabdus thermomarina TaxID=1765737 RepID=A0A6N9TNX0_DISTH|nr:M28 family peptidase [Dissulfurirhabdus thermomarina]NDY41444.1 M28 family peptidase [Dissulfurirhabdus thermomarina]NMX24274.1 M28 family peptidase [Dissulfurirhabdus thermomarina]